MDVRSIEQYAPRLQHYGSTKVWWLQEAREMFAQTAGGHLELVSEFEIAGGGAVHPHSHPTYEFYYVTSGYGRMTVGIETREIKDELIKNTQRSVERGTFGSPTFFVGDEIFFGKDRLRDVEEAILQSK